jgi:CheY-like chemotaxis protein
VTTGLFLVDDDSRSRSALAEILRASQMTVTEMGDGIECIDLLATNEPDAIVLDLDMPVFDGERLIDYLEAVAPHLLPRVIIVTGSSGFVRRRDWPVRAVLLKPVDPRELLTVVSNLTSPRSAAPADAPP